MNFIQTCFRSRIIRKITAATLLTGLLICLATFLLYYCVFKNRLHENAIQNAISQNELLSNTINYEMTDLKAMAQTIVYSSQLKEQLLTYQTNHTLAQESTIRLYLSSLVSGMTRIQSAVIETPTGEQLISINNLNAEEKLQLDSPVFQELKNDKITFRFSNVFYSSTDITQYPEIAYYYRFYIGSAEYFAIIFFDASSLVSKLENMSSAYFDGSILLDHFHNVFYSFNNSQKATQYADQLYTLFESTYESLDNGCYIATNISEAHWNLISYSTNSRLDSYFQTHFNIGILIFVLMLVIMIIIFIPLISRFLNPISKLSLTMKQTSSGNWDSFSDIHTNDEIGELSDSYNHMLESLKQNMEENIGHRLKEEQLVHNLLIAQIDTHFIYNTLNIINTYARQGKMEDVINANISLTKIMQNCLRIKSLDVTDTIEQEISVVQEYWNLVKMRYAADVKLITEIPEEVKKYLVPKNILQPFIENSIFHGLADEETGELSGEVHIRIKTDGNKLHIYILDTGSGYPDTILQSFLTPAEYDKKMTERGKHIGISNISIRLHLIYGDAAALKLYNNNGL